MLVLLDSARRVFQAQDADVRFLAAWIVLFFAAAVVLFFAGSARYLLPMAAPMALLGAVRANRDRCYSRSGAGRFRETLRDGGAPSPRPPPESSRGPETSSRSGGLGAAVS